MWWWVSVVVVVVFGRLRDVEVPAGPLGVEINAALEIKGVVVGATRLRGIRVGDRLVAVNNVPLPEDLFAAREMLSRTSASARTLTVETFVDETWIGAFEVLDVKRAGKTETLARAEVVSADFGVRPSCELRPIVLAETACTQVAAARDAYVVAARGECAYGEKALAVALGGGRGLVVTDTSVAAAPVRMTAERALIDDVSGIVAAWTDRDGGAALRRSAARPRVAGRFLFDNSSCAKTEEVRAAVRREKSVLMNSAPIEGAAISFGSWEATVLGLPNVARSMPIGTRPSECGVPRDLEIARFTEQCDRLEIPPVGTAVALDNFFSCALGPFLDVLERTLDCGVVLLLPPSAPLGTAPPMPETFSNSTRHPLPKTAVAVVSPSAASRIRADLSWNATRLVVKGVSRRPRLLRTWRELLRLRDRPEAWPRDPRHQIRVYGALRRLVAPGGDEEDPDQWAHLQETWSMLQTNRLRASSIADEL